MIKRKRDRLDSMMRRKMPVMVGRMAKDHFQDNFRQGGFVNGGLHPWPKAKRLSSGGSDAASNYGTLLSGRKHLFKSVGYTPADYRVRVFNEVVYAPINNWGGEIDVTVTDRMRRFAWTKFYWTVRVSDAEGMDCYGLDAVTLQSLSSYHQDRKRVLWDELSEWLFPFRLSPSSETSSFVNLYAGNLSSKGLAVSFFLALLTFFLCRNKVSLYRRILMALCVCAAGLSGIVALLFLPWNKYE